VADHIECHHQNQHPMDRKSYLNHLTHNTVAPPALAGGWGLVPKNGLRLVYDPLVARGKE
ncbi:MAG: hypothetical protein ACREYF_13455, partial [Gammaproteobacteria bacterium]